MADRDAHFSMIIASAVLQMNSSRGKSIFLEVDVKCTWNIQWKFSKEWCWDDDLIPLLRCVTWSDLNVEMFSVRSDNAWYVPNAFLASNLKVGTYSFKGSSSVEFHPWSDCFLWTDAIYPKLAKIGGVMCNDVSVCRSNAKKNILLSMRFLAPDSIIPILSSWVSRPLKCDDSHESARSL